MLLAHQSGLKNYGNTIMKKNAATLFCVLAIYVVSLVFNGAALAAVESASSPIEQSTDESFINDSKAPRSVENASARGAIQSSTSMMVGSVAKATGGLVFVLGVIVVVALIAKRTGVAGLASGRRMAVRESLSLGAKERLVLVDYDGQRMMLGVSSGQINVLKTSDIAIPTDEPGDPKLGAKNSLDFQQKLNEFLMKGQR